MTFFCVIVALLVNAVWQREDARSMDRMVVKWQTWVMERVFHSPSRASVIVTILIGAGIPAMAVAGVLVTLDGVALGLLTVLLHVAVLVLALSGENTRSILLGSIQYCRTGAMAAARHHAQQCLQRLSVRSDVDEVAENWVEQLVRAALGQLLRRLYVVMFWYLVAGPVAVVFYLQCLFLWQGQAAEDVPLDADEAGLLRSISEKVIAVIEWLPVRILMVFFALAGDFSEAWSEMADESFWTLDVEQSELLLYRVACAATGTSQGQSTDNKDAYCSELLSATADLMHRTQFVGIVIVALYILVV
jgi:membrane protein required for beta-lactamase induction